MELAEEHMYKINLKIPGWNNQQILNIIAELSNNVSEYGHILELGTLFGRTTYAIGHNKKQSVSLTSVDIFPEIHMSNHMVINFHDGAAGAEEMTLLNSKIVPDPDRLTSDGFVELFKHYTAGIHGMNTVRGFTTLDNKTFPMYDMIIHDASHDYPDVYNDLVHWFPKLKDNGIVVVDDYDIEFPGVIDSVNKFVSENDLFTEMITGRNILIRRYK
jgi:predicted O-methyltransferase YrrM